MNYEFSERLKKLPPYLFVRLEEMTAKKRAEGIDIIDFGIGDPDLPTPDAIVKEMQKQAEINANQKYSSSATPHFQLHLDLLPTQHLKIVSI